MEPLIYLTFLTMFIFQVGGISVKRDTHYHPNYVLVERKTA